MAEVILGETGTRELENAREFERKGRRPKDQGKV
jgi:hypothetical protein